MDIERKERPWTIGPCFKPGDVIYFGLRSDKDSKENTRMVPEMKEVFGPNVLIPSMGTLSAYYSAVQRILSTVSGNTMHKFGALQTDEDRVDFLLTLDYVKDAFTIKPYYEGKSLQESVRMREQGNVAYQKKKFDTALQYYTKSILIAPNAINAHKSSDEYLLALGNRSATLFQMGRYKECVTDIDLALANGYPLQICYKLYDRKARCLLELGDRAEALESFYEVTHVLPEAKLSQAKKDSMMSSTQTQIQELNKYGAQVDKVDTKTASDRESYPPLTGDRSERFPVCSQKINVKYNGKKGRYTVAARDVTVGDILMLEPPFASVLVPDCYAQRCYHCFKMVQLPIPCHQCITVRYCNETCRKVSWDTYHSRECKYLGLMNVSMTGPMSILALRIVLTAGLETILKCRRNPNSQRKDSSTSLFTDSKGMYLDGYIALFNLITHSPQRSQNDLFQYGILVTFLLKILQHLEFFDRSITDRMGITASKALGCVGGTLLRFLQIISCNAIEVTEFTQALDLQKAYPSTIGLAIFPTVSLINHSCNPSMELVFYENKCCVRAIRNIPQDHELNIDYGYIYYLTPLKQRQVSLKSQYFFTCICEPCLDIWGLLSELKNDIPDLKCTKCGESLGLANAMSPTVKKKDPTVAVCRKCGFRQNPIARYERICESRRKAEKAVQDARNWMVDEAIPVLEKHVTLLDKYICLPWKDYAKTVSTLKQAYRSLGNRAPPTPEGAVKRPLIPPPQI